MRGNASPRQFPINEPLKQWPPIGATSQRDCARERTICDGVARDCAQRDGHSRHSSPVFAGGMRDDRRRDHMPVEVEFFG